VDWGDVHLGGPAIDPALAPCTSWALRASSERSRSPVLTQGAFPRLDVELSTAMSDSHRTEIARLDERLVSLRGRL